MPQVTSLPATPPKYGVGSQCCRVARQLEVIGVLGGPPGLEALVPVPGHDPLLGGYCAKVHAFQPRQCIDDVRPAGGSNTTGWDSVWVKPAAESSDSDPTPRFSVLVKMAPTLTLVHLCKISNIRWDDCWWMNAASSYRTIILYCVYGPSRQSTVQTLAVLKHEVGWCSRWNKKINELSQFSRLAMFFVLAILSSMFLNITAAVLSQLLSLI